MQFKTADWALVDLQLSILELPYRRTWLHQAALLVRTYYVNCDDIM